MKDHVTNECFETFLRENADAFQMKPSDRLWPAIAQNARLQPPKHHRSPFVLLSLLLCLMPSAPLQHSSLPPSVSLQTTFPKPDQNG